ncbi:FecCD family ABC transporter permease [Corynebacterium sp. A21]|uniref:FecCD family ABC transporter permease n=1 Tax=Corynebacterium sp. A21 TaxID=3457318 RepID=UPI003FD2510F
MIFFRRRSTAVVALMLLLGVLVLLSFAVGARSIPLTEVVSAFTSHVPGDPDHAVIHDRRIPRTLAAVLAGAAMGVAGALLQALTRNPLADTGVLGINAGAAFAAVVALSVLGLTSPAAFVGFAFGGALLTMLLVTRLGRAAGGGVDPLRLVLAGVALAAVLEGIGEGMALVDPQAFDRLRSWMVGNVDTASLQPALIIAAGLGVAMMLVLPGLGSLNLLALGDDSARALGVDLARVRFLLLGAVTVLAATATAAVGVMTFLGLMVPHLIRRMGCTSERAIVGYSLLVGPCLLLAADILGRVLLPGEMPAGVVVAFLGAPFLIGLAQRSGVRA